MDGATPPAGTAPVGTNGRYTPFKMDLNAPTPMSTVAAGMPECTWLPTPILRSNMEEIGVKCVETEVGGSPNTFLIVECKTGHGNSPIPTGVWYVSILSLTSRLTNWLCSTTAGSSLEAPLFRDACKPLTCVSTFWIGLAFSCCPVSIDQIVTYALA